MSLRVLAGSAAVAIAASAIAYGLLTDTFSITDNEASTGDRPGGPGAVLDVQVGQPVGGQCNQGGVSWAETTIPAVFDHVLSVTYGQQNYWSDNFCVRLNPDTSTITNAAAHVSVENLVETDPSCSTGEVAAGDTDCGTMASGTGELTEVLFWSVYANPNCAAIQAVPVSSFPVGLAEGATNGLFGIDTSTPLCVAFRLNTELDSDDPHLDTIQTDSVTWDWRFTVSE
jgi:hypothetical protein